MSVFAISPRLRRSLPRPTREFAQRAVALRRFDAGIVDLPPPRAKRRHLLRLFQERGHDCFIEAGTYLGDTVDFFLPHARRIISVEIDGELSKAASERFRGYPQVEIVQGDAEREIPRIMSELGRPALVWLDGHHSGEGTMQGEKFEPAVAIIERLRTGGVAPGTTIVVDDLRLFGRLAEFPSLKSLMFAAHGAWPEAQIYMGLDSLIIAL